MADVLIWFGGSVERSVPFAGPVDSNGAVFIPGASAQPRPKQNPLAESRGVLLSGPVDARGDLRP